MHPWLIAKMHQYSDTGNLNLQRNILVKLIPFVEYKRLDFDMDIGSERFLILTLYTCTETLLVYLWNYLIAFIDFLLVSCKHDLTEKRMGKVL